MGNDLAACRKRGVLLALACAVVLWAGSLCGCAFQVGQDAGGAVDEPAQEAPRAAEAGGQPADADGAFGSEAVKASDPDVEGAASPTHSDATEGGSAMETAVEVSANGQAMTAQLEDSASSREFVQLLEEGPLTVSMHDYAGMEKVGNLPRSLTRSDKPTDVGPGDIVLYQGDQITVYYGTNSWNFTRLGSIQGVGSGELRDILGSGDVEVTFALAG